MKHIYIGSWYPSGTLEQYSLLNSRIDFAGHTFQTALLKGLDSVYNDLHVITSPPLSSFPLVKKILFPRVYFSHNDRHIKTDILLGCINLPGINLLSRFLSTYYYLRKLKADQATQVLVYAIDSPTLLALRLWKTKNIKICQIVPDLPEYMSGTKNKIYKAAKRIERHIINWGLKSIDSFILLSPYMKEKLEIHSKPWLLMEGIYIDESSNEPVEKELKTVFLYTGNIGQRTGIVELAKAFSKIKGHDYELWIRGNGAAKEAIEHIATYDSRIKWIPPLKKEELLRLQKKATFLVNPVSPNQEYTRYFFPSKTMEYLASGTPTIMFKLACLPKEYFEHLYFFNNDSIDSMCQKLIEFSQISKHDLFIKGYNAEQFIKRTKNAYIQAKRIKEFLESQ